MTYSHDAPFLLALAAAMSLSAQSAPVPPPASPRTAPEASESRVADPPRERSVAGSRSALVAAQQQRARHRLLQEGARFSKAELEHIEALYQPANRNPVSPEARSGLLTLLEEFPNSNRAGCARVYLAQISSVKEAEAHLRSAIATCTNCWYGDGVQVGALARYELAVLLVRSGRASEADPLEAELRTLFADAVDHRGALLVDLLAVAPRTP